METSGGKQGYVHTSEDKRRQVEASGDKWRQDETGGDKWRQVETRCERWGQVETRWKPDADNTNMHFDELDFTFKQKIWDFGESSSDIKQKKNALDAAVLDLHAEKSNIILDAVEAYLGYIDAAKKLESETDALNSKIESTGQEESRVKKGSGMPSDVLQAKADLAEAQKSKITAEGDLRKAFNKYVKVFKDKPPTNIDSMTLIELSLDGRNQLPKSLEDATQIALENNIDLLKKTIDLLDAEQDVVSAKSDFLPDLDFESTYKYKYNVGASAGAKEEILGKITLKVPFHSSSLSWSMLLSFQPLQYTF